MNGSSMHGIKMQAEFHEGLIRKRSRRSRRRRRGVRPTPQRSFGFLEADAAAAPGLVRVVRMVNSLERAGISVDEMARARAEGALSFAFLERPVFDRFSGLSPLTFSALAAETGVPLDLLMVIREAVGFAQATPDDLVRDDELLIVPAVRRTSSEV